MAGASDTRGKCAEGLARGGRIDDAAIRAWERCHEGLAGAAPDLVVVLVAGASPESAEKALLAVNERASARVVLGASSDGVVTASPVVGGEPAVSVWAACLPEAQLRTFHLEVMRTSDHLAVVGLPARSSTDHCALLLADPWSFPARAFVDGAVAALDDLPLLGGLAGGLAPGSARMLIDGRVVNRGAVGVMIGGVRVRAAVAHSTRPVGPALTVTRASEDMVIELAGSPAAEVIDRVVAALPGHDQALASAGLLMGVVLDEYADEHGQGDFAVQPVLEVDRRTGRAYVAEPIPIGTTVHLHVVDPEAARSEIAQASRAAAQSGAQGVLVFYGSPRGPLSGDAQGDVLSVRRELACDGVTAMVTHGSIGPVGQGNRLLGFATTMLIVPNS